MKHEIKLRYQDITSLREFLADARNNGFANDRSLEGFLWLRNFTEIVPISLTEYKHMRPDEHEFVIKIDE